VGNRARTREADTGSSFAAFLRPLRSQDEAGFPKGPKVTKKPDSRKPKHAHVPKLKIPKVTSESARTALRVKTRLREADGQSIGGGKYRVILIQEGLGNLRDCFYYTKECLQSSVGVFEGIKCFADHPNQIEEQIHPERSTRDILGHYEDAEYVETDGRGSIEATLILCEGEHFDWAKSLLTNALEYATKYSDADFVGFSINAQGEAGNADIADFLGSTDVPPSILPKLQKAQADGVTELRPVSALRDAVSVDLVTEAGAGGKILTMMERNKLPMKTKTNPKTKPNRESRTSRPAKTREAQAREQEHEDVELQEDGAPAGGADPGTQDHADAGQDVALFKKMIGQYLGHDSGVDDEEAMKMAKHSFEHFKQGGMEEHEAYEAAGSHLKAAAAIGKSMHGETQESEEHEEEAAESEAHEESEEHEEAGDGGGAPPAASGKKGPPMAQEANRSNKEVTKLRAEVASLRESVQKQRVDRYLDKKLQACDKSPEWVKAFREALGKPRSVAHVEETWDVFNRAAEAALAESDAGEGDDPLVTERDSGRFRESGNANVISFADCAK
jgi:hypothetical protein